MVRLEFDLDSRLICAESGQPHSSPSGGVEDGVLYDGRYILACLAKQDMMWNGESIDISK